MPNIRIKSIKIKNYRSFGEGENGDGDGRTDGSGAYTKNSNSDAGAVYIVAGNAGKVSDGTFDHEAMFYSVSRLGSCEIEVNNDKMDVKFIRDNGDIEDYILDVRKKLHSLVGWNFISDKDKYAPWSIYMWRWITMM